MAHMRLVEMARLVGRTPQAVLYAETAGSIPLRDVKVGRRTAWSAKLQKKVIKHFQKQDERRK